MKVYFCGSVSKAGRCCELLANHDGPHQSTIAIYRDGLSDVSTWTTEQQSVDSGRSRVGLYVPSIRHAICVNRPHLYTVSGVWCTRLVRTGANRDPMRDWVNREAVKHANKLNGQDWPEIHL